MTKKVTKKTLNKCLGFMETEPAPLPLYLTIVVGQLYWLRILTIFFERQTGLATTVGF